MFELISRVNLILKSFPFFIVSMFKEVQEIKLFGSIYQIRSNCRKIGVDGRIYVLRENYSPDIQGAIRHFVRTNSVFLDVGANTGFFSKWWLTNFNERVCAFEPEPNTFISLKKNVNAELFQLAVADSSGQINFSCRHDHGSSGISSENEFSDFSVTKTSLDMWFLDQNKFWLKDNSPLIIKLDIEGFEPLAILGMKETLVKRNPVIVAEWRYLSRCDPNLRADAINLMLAAGYKFYDLRGKMIDLNFFSGDFMAFNESHVEII
jgi:FkbM family methyltransferase